MTIILIICVIAALAYFGKLGGLNSSLRNAWAGNRTLTLIVAFLVLYWLAPVFATSLMVPIFIIIGVSYMARAWR